MNNEEMLREALKNIAGIGGGLSGEDAIEMSAIAGKALEDTDDEPEGCPSCGGKYKPISLWASSKNGITRCFDSWHDCDYFINRQSADIPPEAES